ncbi:MAG: DivIVA domain-containing protein [Candidatus Hydrogenedentes bacterium]|nr:DivIVA domain-containing protein [Candidatus Hydrogenedentota bacterium]
MEKNKIMDEVLGDTPAITASDLYSADFKTAFRGFNKAEVAAFLERAADAFERLQQQVASLREEAEAREAELGALRAMEHSLADALAAAQRMSDSTIEQARREADLIRREAELIREAARKNALAVPESLREEIADLRENRKRLKADMRAVLNLYDALLRENGDTRYEMLDVLPAEEDTAGRDAALEAPGDRQNAGPRASDHDDHHDGGGDVAIMEDDHMPHLENDR